MSILLSNSSALYVWPQVESLGRNASERYRGRRAPEFDPASFGAFMDATEKTPTGFVHPIAPLGIPGPVHLMVCSDKARRSQRGSVCHVWSRDLPPNSVANLTDDILVSTPEFLFLQAAHRLPFLRLVEFGYELCALYTYRIPGRAYTELRAPMTTTARITAYLEGCSGAPGVRNARAAIPQVLDRSRSIRESKLAVSLVLPRWRGGQAVSDLELNRRVPLNAEERKAAGKRYYELDFSVCDGMFALEYFGKEEHSGAIRETRDIRRESILQGKNIAVHGVTKSQAENVMELERLAKLLYAATGDRWRAPSAAHEKAMRDLLRQLYPRK